MQGLAFDAQLFEGVIADAKCVADLVLLLPRAKGRTYGGQQGLRADGAFEQNGLAECAARLLEVAAAKVFAASGSKQDDGEIGPGLLVQEKGAEMFDEALAERFFGEDQGTDGVGGGCGEERRGIGAGGCFHGLLTQR